MPNRTADLDSARPPGRTRAGCFLIGSGPSLNSIDVKKLSNHDTIAFNRSYIAWDDWAFHPSYYACFDPVTLADNAAEIKELIQQSSVKRFYLGRSASEHGIVSPDLSDQTVPAGRVTLVTLIDSGTFRTDTNVMGDFGNAGATSLQVLASLGYRRVVMVGVDARYSEYHATGGEEYLQDSGDPDHFTAAYSNGKRRRARPDLDRILGRWPEAAAACNSGGIEVRNASPGSSLTCFETMEFEDALAWIGAARFAG